MVDTSIIKELDQIIIMNEMVIKKATRLKKKIEGEVSTSPEKSPSSLNDQHMKAISTRRKKFIKSEVA